MRLTHNRQKRGLSWGERGRGGRIERGKKEDREGGGNLTS